MAAPFDKQPRNGVRTALQFAVAGPFIGGIVYLVLMVLSVDAPSTPLRVLFAVGGAVPLYPFSLFFGVIPAIVTGALYATVLETGWVDPKNYKGRVAVAAMIGGTLCALFFSGFDVADRIGNIRSEAISGLLTGAVAGGLCALVFPAPQPKAAI